MERNPSWIAAYIGGTLMPLLCLAMILVDHLAILIPIMVILLALTAVLVYVASSLGRSPADRARLDELEPFPADPGQEGRS